MDDIVARGRSRHRNQRQAQVRSRVRFCSSRIAPSADATSVEQSFPLRTFAMHRGHLPAVASALLTATGAVPAARRDGAGVTGFVRHQQPAAAPTASNRGCLYENAVATDRSAVSLLHLAEQAPAEVVGALSQLGRPIRVSSVLSIWPRLAPAPPRGTCLDASAETPGCRAGRPRVHASPHTASVAQEGPS